MMEPTWRRKIGHIRENFLQKVLCELPRPVAMEGQLVQRPCGQRGRAHPSS